MGAYSLLVSDTNGCLAESDTILYNPVAVEDEVTDIYGLTLYPNPTSGIVNIRTLRPIDWYVTVRITNMFGQKLREFQMAHLISDAVFDLRDLASGVYLMEIETEKGERSVIRFMIE
ncbi:MAG TPA: T9SS type A sorting domain-containing protein [Bacteroidetes bacterium]|nr:T9SS type A sorting domain-containing protein [Bacteroidota bacterium]